MLIQYHFHNFMGLEMESPLIPIPLQSHTYSKYFHQHWFVKTVD